MIPRLYCPLRLRAGDTIELPADAAHHASRVLRLRESDAVTLFDGQGGEFDARLSRIDARVVLVALGKHREIERESPLKVTLLQGLAAADRMDYAIQKAVEMGVAAIAPVTTARSVARLDATRAAKRAMHWRSVIVASCEQCGRNRLPPLRPLSGFAEALDPLHATAGDSTTASALSLVLAPGDGIPLASFERPVGAIRLLVGPEGGLTAEELAAAISAGFSVASLGPRVLRTETAGAAALAAMNALWGDWR